jgi:pilus assembly protein FimV
MLALLSLKNNPKGGVVRTITLKHWVLAVLVFLLMPWVADAAGLGRLSVLSSLGQPLIAEIELASVEKEELATLSARLASPDAYKQANLQYGPALAGLRLSIQKRPDGEAYIKVTTSRPINEPFIDLMVEISWASGRITREYTALIDPPGYTGATTAPAPVTLPEISPVAAPETPVAAAPIESPDVAAPTAMGGKDYGPIKRGETLYKIAESIKPEGVTLEQMLVGLYRNNPDAFVKNMSRMKTGKILRVPEKEELAATTQREAVKEVRVQAADWNAYRRKLADAAATATESQGAVSGKITTRVEDRAAAGGAKDVVRLSKGEPPRDAQGAGEPGNMANRLRTLEEEAIAREKALTEANERIAQLEKNIKDMQQLLAIKSPGMAAVQQKVETKPGKPAPEPAAAKPETAPPAIATKKEEPKVAVAPAKPAVKAKPTPKPKPKVVPPPPEPGLMDMLMDNLPLLGGGAAILLGGLGFWMVRRRRSQAEAEEEPAIKSAPTLGKEDIAAVSGMSAVQPAATLTGSASEAAVAAPPTDEVDPLAEAEVYIAYGRDAQAEEILKDALNKNPNREDVQLKLLEIYAGRKDKSGFNGVAGTLNKLTAGQGEIWLKVAGMGYALDPGNPLYDAGKDASSAMQPPAGATTGSDLDFDLGVSGGGATATDISFDPIAAQEPRTERTVMMQPGAMHAMAGEAEKEGEAAAETLMPDFTLDIPEAGSSAATATDISLEAHSPAEATSSAIDFSIELPDAGAAETDSKAGQGAPATRAEEAGAGTDFKLDMGDINLNLDDKTISGAATAEGEKDAHWDDVQTKFDLAKAYQEMGDKDGAKEILQEVIKEGDAQQQAEAKKLLENLN